MSETLLVPPISFIHLVCPLSRHRKTIMSRFLVLFVALCSTALVPLEVALASMRKATTTEERRRLPPPQGLGAMKGKGRAGVARRPTITGPDAFVVVPSVSSLEDGETVHALEHENPKSELVDLPASQQGGWFCPSHRSEDILTLDRFLLGTMALPRSVACGNKHYLMFGRKNCSLALENQVGVGGINCCVAMWKYDEQLRGDVEVRRAVGGGKLRCGSTTRSSCGEDS